MHSTRAIVKTSWLLFVIQLVLPVAWTLTNHLLLKAAKESRGTCLEKSETPQVDTWETVESVFQDCWLLSCPMYRGHFWEANPKPCRLMLVGQHCAFQLSLTLLWFHYPLPIGDCGVVFTYMTDPVSSSCPIPGPHSQWRLTLRSSECLYRFFRRLSFPFPVVLYL